MPLGAKILRIIFEDGTNYRIISYLSNGVYHCRVYRNINMARDIIIANLSDTPYKSDMDAFEAGFKEAMKHARERRKK